MLKEEEKQNICNCLFSTFILGKNDCTFIPEPSIDIHPEFTFNRELKDLEILEDFEPDLIVLFNNEKITWEGNDYYKIYRIVGGRHLSHDMTILEPLGIRYYTNGISGHDGLYIVMHDRAIIMNADCPIMHGSVRSHFYHEDREMHAKITKILSEGY